MEINARDYFILFTVTLILVGLLTPLVRKFAISKQILDLPNSNHKTHQQAVPYLGGVAIALGIIIVTYAALITKGSSTNNFLLATSLIGPAIALGLVGLWDDIKNLSPLPRFIGQSLTGLLVSVFLILGDNVANLTSLTLLDFLITIFWVVGICNSINFFDNLDGGAAGTVAISALFLTYLTLQSGQSFIAALAIVIAGATFGFLIWNRPPARIYMGDAGALFLGVLIATLSIRLNPITESTLASLAVPILLLGIPILDTGVAVLSRVRRGISPFQGGTDHLSHRLIRLGLSRKVSVVVLWFLSVVFGILVLILTNINSQFELLIVFSSALLWIMLFTAFFKTSDT
jgi:UDP-GlcNAc:undecaprenyl-phosphate GlcNAc-1-phosphate transferase